MSDSDPLVRRESETVHYGEDFQQEFVREEVYRDTFVHAKANFLQLPEDQLLFFHKPGARLSA